MDIVNVIERRMKWQNFSLKKKLITPIITIGALLLMLSIMQIMTLNTLSNNYSHIHEHYLPATNAILNADRDLYQAQIAERSIAMGSKEASFNAIHKDNLAQVQRRVNSLLSQNVSQAIQENTQAFLDAYARYQPKTLQLVQDIMSNSINIEAATAMSTGPLNNEFEQLRNQLDQIGEQLNQQTTLLHQNNQSEKVNSLIGTLVMVLIAVVLIAIISVFFPKLIVDPVNHLSKELEELAIGNGDLTRRMRNLGQDEIGVMSRNFNRFLSGLQQLMADIQGAGNAVGIARGSLKQGSEDCLEVSKQYTQDMEKLTKSNHEMGLAMGEVAQNTQQVAQEANESIAVIQEVSEHFGDAKIEIESLADNIDSANSIITTLAQETSNIASVLDVINDIADQTNLLALNAAIEAARAGEQGRGFAVVADEVRTLASRTQNSTKDISQMINTLKSEANRAVHSMEGAQEKAGRSVESSQHSESQVQTVSDSLNQISQRITQTASAVEQQTSSITEINHNINHTQELSQQGMLNAHAIGEAVETLNTQAEKLRALIMGFNV